jgi:hypothetical protein
LIVFVLLLPRRVVILWKTIIVAIRCGFWIISLIVVRRLSSSYSGTQRGARRL